MAPPLLALVVPVKLPFNTGVIGENENMDDNGPNGVDVLSLDMDTGGGGGGVDDVSTGLKEGALCPRKGERFTPFVLPLFGGVSRSCPAIDVSRTGDVDTISGDPIIGGDGCLAIATPDSDGSIELAKSTVDVGNGLIDDDEGAAGHFGCVCISFTIFARN